MNNLPRKIFIDLGCGKCDDLFIWKNNNPDFICYGIEASRNYVKEWEKIKKENPEINLINKTAWINNGTISFYEQRNDNPQGSTLIKDKKGVGSMIQTYVEAFDFSEWIQQFQNDHVVLMMDIEGAKYEVLNKMINDGTINIVNKLFYESHAHKIDDDYVKNLALSVENKLDNLHIKCHKIGGNDIINSESHGE